MSQAPELVRLVAEDGSDIGTAEKATVHTRSTPLHLAFSCHIFDGSGRILLSRRALAKPTWPGVWTNSFCGHPAPGESFEDALRRRAEFELGMGLSDLSPVLPDFRYRATDASGTVENEICPVYTALWTGDAATPLQPNPEEVCDWRWVDPKEVLKAAAAVPFVFSPWLVLQLEQGIFSA